ncbi:MAG: hypothetical protein P8Y43_06235 [Sulfurovaceae bacterium]
MNYDGMTVNERLYLSGLLDIFDKAVKQKDIEKVIKILKSVELKEDNIKLIIKELFSDSTSPRV